MKVFIEFEAITLYTEHCYVQYPFLHVEDESGKLRKKLASLTDYSFYQNHFCIEGKDENGSTIYVGYDDGVLSLGSTICAMRDSKQINLNQQVIIAL